jgi:hypothetical protein
VRRRGYARYRFLKGVQGLPPGGRVRAGVGHGELTRAVQGRGEGEDWSGGVAQGGGAGAQVPPPARVGRERQALNPELEVRGDFKYVVVTGST